MLIQKLKENIKTMRIILVIFSMISIITFIIALCFLIPFFGFSLFSLIFCFFSIAFAIGVLGFAAGIATTKRDILLVERGEYSTIRGKAIAHFKETTSNRQLFKRIVGAVFLTRDNDEIPLRVGKIELDKYYEVHTSKLTNTSAIESGKVLKKSRLNVTIDSVSSYIYLFNALLCIAIFASILFVVAVVRVEYIKFNGQETTIIDIRTKGDEDSETRYIVYNFDGKEYEAVTDIDFGLKKNDKIIVLKSNPEVYQAVRSKYYWQLIFGGVSLLTYFSVLLLHILSKNKRKDINYDMVKV